MPQIFKIGSYLVYFWVNEGKPLEPVHVHVSKGIPSSSATKLWITKNGKCIVCNNNSKIPKKELRVIISVIEARYMEIFQKWYDVFSEIYFYC